METIPVMFVCATGLEAVVRDDVASLPGVANVDGAYRRVYATLPTSALGAVSHVRSADDVFLHLAMWSKIGHTRAMLPEFEARAANLALASVPDALLPVRRVAGIIRFSVSVSFVGKRNYRTDEVIQRLASGVVGGTGWRFVEQDPDADLNLRVMIDHETADVGVRVLARPLRHRPWLIGHRPGGLRPPIAAAMVRLAAIAPGERVLDPFAGSGTIAIEAALAGGRTMGSDLDAAALGLARLRSTAAASDAEFVRADAGRLPFRDATFDVVLANPPWGRQAELVGTATGGLRDAAAEIARVVRPGGRVVVLSTDSEALASTELVEVDRLTVSVSGQRPDLVVSVRRQPASGTAFADRSAAESLV